MAPSPSQRALLPLTSTASVVIAAIVAFQPSCSEPIVHVTDHAASVLLPVDAVLLIAYLYVIGVLDTLTSTPRAYLLLEFAGTADAISTAVTGWDERARIAMALSAGLHCLAAFLYTTLLLGWLLWLTTAAHAARQPQLAAAANAFAACSLPMGAAYLGCHACVAAVLTSGAPHTPTRRSDRLARAAHACISTFFGIMIPAAIFAIGASIVLPFVR